jgi:hypothetical protein
VKWDKFIQEYNDLTSLVFYHLYDMTDNENQKLTIFKFKNLLKTSSIKYYYSYEIAYKQINFQIDIKQPGFTVNSINVFFNEENNIRYSLRENDFFNRQSLSNINVHKTVFLWTYFLMFINSINYGLEESE